MTAKRGARAVIGLVTALLAAMSTRCEGDFRPDDFHCEEAAKRIETCCPGADPTRIGCTYQQGCDGDGKYAQIPVATAECIRDASCARIVEQGICATLSTKEELSGSAGSSSLGLTCAP